MLHAIYDAVLRAAIGTRFLIAPGATTLSAGDALVDLAMPTNGISDDDETGAAAIHVPFIIDGIQYLLSAAKSGAAATLAYVENVAHSSSAPADGYVQQDDTTCYYLLCLDTSGNVKIVKGKDNGLVPVAPATLCPFAVVKIVLDGATSGFTAGTTAWNATGVTATWEDQFCVVPASPTFAGTPA